MNGMANICELSFKPRELEEAKCADKLRPKGKAAKYAGWPVLHRGYEMLPGDKREPNPFGSLSETWKTRMVPRLGKLIVRLADNHAGMRSRKKRMPCCNSVDTGLNITRCESKPTSDWCFFAREFGELT